MKNVLVNTVTEYHLPTYANSSEASVLDANSCIFIGSPSADTVFRVSQDSFNKANRHFFHLKRNEELLVNALRNMLRKSNFDELNEALENEEISEQQFNDELNNNRDKYAITLKGIERSADIINVLDISERISLNLRQLTLSEVSEIFSIRENDLLNALNPQVPIVI